MMWHFTIYILFFFSLLLPNTLQAQESYGFAYVEIYKYQTSPVLAQKGGLFKDINVTFSLLKTHDPRITAKDIPAYEEAFAPFSLDERFDEANTSYWLRVDLGEHFPSGRFIYGYADAEFSEHTVAPSQDLEKLYSKGIHLFEASYTKGSDARVYYFRLEPRHFRTPFIHLSVSTPKSYFSGVSWKLQRQLLMGLLMGIILMAGIYNLTLFFSNKERMFLYYALMQMFVLLLLYDYSDAFFWEEDSLISRNPIYESLIALLGTLFALLFSREFLDMRRTLPRLHKVLSVGIVLVVADMLLAVVYHSLIVTYELLPILIIFVVYGAYRRIRAGYAPAKYYMAGWVMLAAAIFFGSVDIWSRYLPVEPIYFGSVGEALFFSFALSAKMHLIIREKELQQQLLVQQNKLSALGELLGNIAHQWRQPLTRLGYVLMNLQSAQKHGELDAAYLEKKIAAANGQLKHLSETIDTFSSFYAPQKAKETFELVKAVDETLEIIGDALRLDGITVNMVHEREVIVHTYKSELKQVLLNLLQNTKEHFTETFVPQPEITLIVETARIIVEDNGGGIPEAIKEKIFEPYFTTKRSGTGIGLYMSKVIVEHNMGGSLSVMNTHWGCRFTISLPEEIIKDCQTAPL